MEKKAGPGGRQHWIATVAIPRSVDPVSGGDVSGGEACGQRALPVARIASTAAP